MYAAVSVTLKTECFFVRAEEEERLDANRTAAERTRRKEGRTVGALSTHGNKAHQHLTPTSARAGGSYPLLTPQGSFKRCEAPMSPGGRGL